MNKDHVIEPRSPQGNLPIEVGDLVMVVKPCMCCGGTVALGRIFTVTGFRGTHTCACGDTSDGIYALKEDGFHRHDIRRLRKIPPLSREDSIETTKSDDMSIKV